MNNESSNMLFENRLENVKSEIRSLGDLALESNSETISLLEKYDDEIYNSIIKRSNEIDIDAIDLERDCIKFMAREQPYAKDLMFIESTLRIISHIKRIGRLTLNIAKSIKKLQDIDVPLKIIKELSCMADYVQLMLSKAIDTFLNQDMIRAKELAIDDDKVDDLCDSIFSQITVEALENEKIIPNIIDIILLARYYERIADRAVNIGSRTIFVMTLERPDIGPVE